MQMLLLGGNHTKFELTAARFGALFASAFVGTLLSTAMPASAMTYSLFYSFQGGSDGQNPDASLALLGGKLYGTTSQGGDVSCVPQTGCGTVFSITTAGVETVLYAFKGGNDGGGPVSRLINVEGTLYGTTEGGGGNTGLGSVYSITTAGVEKVLYTFPGGGDLGANPLAAPNDVKGTLYGTTESGGLDACGQTYYCGTVFAVTPGGDLSWSYAFKGGSDAANPESKLFNLGGKLYGTTLGGGAKRSGTVYRITTTGTEKVIYSFKGGRDGSAPSSQLIGVGGTLYGTTSEGGGSGCGGLGCGTVYSVTTAGVEKVVYAFKGGSDGFYPSSGLINPSGTLYGTTSYGGGSGCGGYGCGTVYSVTTTGVETVVYAFMGGNDGAIPNDTLANVSGTLWGTTNGGGTGTCSGSNYGCGTVFKLKP